MPTTCHTLALVSKSAAMRLLLLPPTTKDETRTLTLMHNNTCRLLVTKHQHQPRSTVYTHAAVCGCLAISIVTPDPLLYYTNRWGRNQEVASEDPFINGLYGIAYSKGLQNGQDPRYLQAVTTLKHFDACMSHSTASLTGCPTHPPSTNIA